MRPPPTIQELATAAERACARALGTAAYTVQPASGDPDDGVVVAIHDWTDENCVALVDATLEELRRELPGLDVGGYFLVVLEPLAERHWAALPAETRADVPAGVGLSNVFTVADPIVGSADWLPRLLARAIGASEVPTITTKYQVVAGPADRYEFTAGDSVMFGGRDSAQLWRRYMSTTLGLVPSVFQYRVPGVFSPAASIRELASIARDQAWSMITVEDLGCATRVSELRGRPRVAVRCRGNAMANSNYALSA